ncbi:MAG: hypothetical protein ABEJ28_12460 [Salinigranum sp.]
MIGRNPLDDDGPLADLAGPPALPTQFVYLNVAALGVAGLLSLAAPALGPASMALCVVWAVLTYDRARYRSRKRTERLDSRLSREFWD